MNMNDKQEYDKQEFQWQVKRWAPNTVWKLETIILYKGDKSAYINTQVPIAIDHRKTKVSPITTCPETFPETPEPTTTSLPS